KPNTTVSLKNLSFRNGGSSNDTGAPAILNEGTLTIDSSTISDNKGSRGGGIANVGRLLVKSCIFSKNFGQAVGPIQNYGELVVDGSSFNDNGGEAAGAIFTRGALSTLSVRNSVFVGNSAFGGGAITSFSGAPIEVVNSAFYDNSGNSVGAIYIEGKGTGTV